jgi:membrane protease YdiL (CAAX protease family)
LRYVEDVIKKYETETVDVYLNAKKIKRSELKPFYFWYVNIDKSVSDTVKTAGMSFGGGILFLLLISMFNPTINTTIGERDANTFKILLMNPVNIHEIFFGKYLNVAFQGLISLIPYSLELIIFYAWGSTNQIFEILPIITFIKVLVIVAFIISTAISVSSLCFLACSFAKSKSQAQSLISLLMFCIAIPIGVIGIMNIKLSYFSALLPIINLSLVTENILLESPNYLAIFVGAITNLVISIGLIWFSLGAFSIQWKGVGESKGLNDVLNLKRRKATKLAPAHAFLAFALAFLGYTYGSLIFASFNIDLFAYLFGPILFCLGTSLFIIQYSGLDLNNVFNWYGIDWKYSLKILFSAALLSLGFNQMINNEVVSEMFKMDFPAIFETNQFASILSYFLLFAVLPGFAEEILFRGIIFKGLRSQYSLLISTVVSSMLFAIIHFSLFKWGHTFVVGIILAIMYEKRGMISCMFMHFCFNSFGLLFGLNSSLAQQISNMPFSIKSAILPLSFLMIFFLLKSPKNLQEKTEF